MGKTLNVGRQKSVGHFPEHHCSPEDEKGGEVDERLGQQVKIAHEVRVQINSRGTPRIKVQRGRKKNWAMEKVKEK